MIKMSNKAALFSYHIGKINSLIIYSVSEVRGIEHHIPLLEMLIITAFLEHNLTVPINLKNIQTEPQNFHFYRSIIEKYCASIWRVMQNSYLLQQY